MIVSIKTKRIIRAEVNCFLYGIAQLFCTPIKDWSQECRAYNEKGDLVFLGHVKGSLFVKKCGVLQVNSDMKVVKSFYELTI